MKKTLLALAFMSVTSLLASDAAATFKKCAGCHGEKGEKSNFAKLQGLSKDDVVAKLNGYKNGQGGAKKGMMIPQAKSLNDMQITALADLISKF